MSLNHLLGIVHADPSRYLRRKDWRHLSFQEMAALMLSPVSLHDDILRYMSDSLKWIPSYNPSKQEKHRGLDLYGITLITNAGASRAGSVFRAWARVFSLGPEKLELTGPWATIVGSKKPGRYSVIRLQRDPLVRKLESLATQCDEVASDGTKSFVLHLGI